MRRLLVSFEGQDGSGKSTLLNFVSEKLIQEAVAVLVVPEFSSNVLGKFLQDLISQNKFLRISTVTPSALTETMYVLSDLYSQDELEIRPALQKQLVVLKERHVDSILACQIPKIVNDYPSSSIEELFAWLIEASAKLTQPDLTVFLHVQKDMLQKRIEGRGERATEEDFMVFKKRQDIYDRIAADSQQRWFNLPNDGDPLIAVNRIVAEIKARLAS